MIRDPHPSDRAGGGSVGTVPSTDRHAFVETFADVARQFPPALSARQRAASWQRLQQALASGRPIHDARSSWWASLWANRSARLGLTFAIAAVLIPVAWRIARNVPPPAVQFVVSRDGRADVGGIPGADVSATDGPITLRFTDGSRVWMPRSARLTVSSLTSSGSAVRLLDGTVEVDVQHRPDTTWTFEAGPYVVHVKGTSFTLGWQAGSHRFQLTMHTGVVALVAPGVHAPRSVAGGESVILDEAGRAPPQSAGEHAPAEMPAPSPAARAAGDAGPTARDESRRKSPGHRAERSLPPHAAWAPLLTRGDFEAIVEQANRAGVDACLGLETEQNLAALADAARYTQRGDLARRSLLALRARFPASDRARDAAFFLARLSETSSTGGHEALSWYDRYLRESAQGSYAEQALGRQMILLRRSHELSAARGVAEGYLRTYPRGAYASEATGLLVDPARP